ncbi:MAG: S9 family peptidase [Bryobacteraceae bacterium]
MIRSCASRAAVVLLVLAISCQAADPILATDLLRLKEVIDVCAAGDGSFAVYSVRSVIGTAPDSTREASFPRYSYQDHLWMADFRDPNARPIQLTFDDQQDTAPAISPDGKRLAFVRLENATGAPPQVWIMPLSQPGEARKITNLEFGAVDPRWQPDGKAILVSSAIPISKLPGKPPFSEERPNRDWWDSGRPDSGKPVDARPDGTWREIRSWLDENSRRHNPEDILQMDFLAEEGLSGERRFTELFLVDVESHSPKTVQITHSFIEHANAAWAPGGNTVVFAARPMSGEPPDRLPQRSSIWVMNRDGSNEQVLLNDDRYNFTLPHFTSDGKHILALGVQSDESTYRQAALVMCDRDGARPRWLTPENEPSVQQPKTLDDKAYYTVNFEGGQHLRVIDLKTSQIKELISGPVGVNVFAVAPGKIVYGLIGAPDPSELYLSAGNRQQPIEPGIGPGLKQPARRRQRLPLAPIFDRAPINRRLTDLNASWLETKELSLPEEHWIRRPDGTRVEYWLMKPTHFDSSKKYPWVVEMHGGPAAMWGPGEFSMWHEFQTFCSFGYGVLYANPRGSSGYGYLFQRANYKDWGDGPMGDILSALDDAAMSEPAIDRRRLFLTGGSYAGYLTAWTIAHDHRFKAAAAQRGVYDLATFFGEGNAYRLVPEEFGGYPWEPDTRRLLQDESPISYVTQIDTPLLILHGSEDGRTGVVQGQMLFRALKELGKPVEYIRYPGAGHELTRSGPPEQRIDHLLRIIEFFERYANNDRPAPRVVEAE